MPQDDDVTPGRVAFLEPSVRRLIAPNSSPYTYTGTCTYIVGQGKVAVIDPGPDDASHINALLHATGSERISHLIITHTHRDHTAGIARLREATGATVIGCAPHFAARERHAGETGEAGADFAYAPDRILAAGERVEGDDWALTAVPTPGHTANHLCFALAQSGALFSGDHVMAWSTTLVAPPDGSMDDYIRSLEMLRERDDRVYWPGHGGPVREPRRFVRALLHHRRQREAAILARIEAGDSLISEIVPRLYEGLAPSLQGGAALSVFAHLESLVAQGMVVTDGATQLDSRFRLA